MKRLGKKVTRKTGSLQMYVFCMCTTCSCTVKVNSYTSKYNNQNGNVQ